ncbi:unnamed protein product (macronuclear) [Paramecium tetraurelia]|uniref:Potassium channel domain-containing protein n=1 Tax=Paramecium tetraurelia TaxID=5888 RepID=A0D7S5_PARTE|nr:uncharacterized protein GSPATT00014059001 [Paramecium tetraurelia]CAK79092.1 unnamed protein product [Paramecium tetraurelia]|eukprot:XP_001446489.1 hypothetical protein (macronuclear) [Paramecium tetraurelia strain d4-2]
MSKIEQQHIQNFDLALELRAVQNEDLEPQYLEHCLRDTRRQLSITNNQIQSQTKSEKSNDAYDFRTPKNTTHLNLNNLPSNDAQQIHLLTPNSKNQEKQKNTGSSIMQFFFIRRFLEKLTFQRKKLENLNDTHLNLIDDKASDKAILQEYKQTKVQKGLTINQLNRIVATKIEIKENRWDKFKSALQEQKQNAIKQITLIANKIPLIQPESDFKLYWDIFASLFRIILVILAPLEISFTTKILFQNYLGLTITIFLILQLDLFVRINTLCYENGKAITDRWEIIKRQLNKSWFTDFSVIILIVAFMANPHAQDGYDLFLLILLTQYKHIFEGISKIDQISYFTRPQRGIIGLIKFLTSLLYILHLFSCIWFWFSSLDQSNSWILNKELNGQTWQLQYLESIYFAIVTMLTIGYGDNVPKNSIEKIVAIIFILGACLWFSYSVNFIGAIMNDITQNQVERSQKLRVINKYMTQRQIPFSLQHQVQEYLTYRWKEDDEVDLEMEQLLLEQLSDELKEELEKQANKVFIKKSELLQKYFSAEFRNALFKSIKRKIIQPQNIFSTEMNGHQHLCYVEQGAILYQHKDRKQRPKMNAQILQGQFFCVKEFIMQNPEYELFKAQSYVSLLMLSKMDFLETLKDFPNDFQKYCQLRDTYSLSNEELLIQYANFCPACNNFDHQLKSCGQVQLKLNQEVILKKHIMNQEQIRQKFKRKTLDKPIQTRAELAFVQECASYFSNENQNFINEQTKLQLVYEADNDSIQGNSETHNVYDALPSVNIIQFNDMLASNNKSTQIKTLPRLEFEEEKPKVKEDLTKSNVLSPQYARIQRRTSQPSKQLQRKNTRSHSILTQMIEIAEEPHETTVLIHEDEQLKKDQFFSQNMKENIRCLYNKLLRTQDDKDNSVKQGLHSLQYIYWQQNAITLEDFETVQNYDFYYPQSNVHYIIDAVNKNLHQWQFEILNKYQKYLYHPFLFITKFLKLKRLQQQTGGSNLVTKFKKAQKKIWLIQLRNNLSSKKIISSTKISKSKLSSIIPCSQDSLPSIQMSSN